MKKDVYGKTLQIGDNVHPLGRGNKCLYIIELGETTAGVSSDKNATDCMGVNYNRLVKMKTQTVVG